MILPPTKTFYANRRLQVYPKDNCHEALVAFDVVNATWKITGPDTKEGQATMAVYLASQDANGDGFPDAGQKPLSCIPFTFTGKRVGVMPSCELTPMPASANP